MAAVKPKPKCNYWDKCYRKDRNHKKAFLHPEDDDDADTTSTVDIIIIKTDKTQKKGGKRAAVHWISEDEDDDDKVSSTPKKKSKKTTDGVEESNMKCKYWQNCNRKDPKHFKEFIHPMDNDDDDTAGTSNTTDDDIDVKPLNVMSDGQNVKTPCDKYRMKRTGDHYYCSCVGWKTQNKSVDKRTCKHLKAHLGEEYEAERIKVTDDEVKVTTTQSKREKRKIPEEKILRAPIPEVMLAHKYDESINPIGWWMSEKLDGVRAYWSGSKFYSRLKNPFIAPEWFIEDLPRHISLDGELFGGRGKFQSTVSIVKSQGSDRWKNIKYYIFDVPSMGNAPFEERMKTVKDYFEENPSEYVVIVDQTKVTKQSDIDTELKRVEGLGGEGLMIRKPKSAYEHGRSHCLLKIKTFHDAEARVIGYEKGKGRNTGVVGALRCVMECGTEFCVGSGLKDSDRRKPPKKGSIITYKFQELTNSGTPRFPSYLGIRIDMAGPKDAVLPPKITD